MTHWWGFPHRLSAVWFFPDGFPGDGAAGVSTVNRLNFDPKFLDFVDAARTPDSDDWAVF